MYGVVNFVAIVRVWSYPSENALNRWMARHGLQADSSSRSLVAAYLRRTRWIRTIGFLIGWNLPLVWLLVTRSVRRMHELGEFWWVAGFALGIVVEELVRPRSEVGSSATLEPRRLPQYLPGFTRIDGWILAGIVVLLAVLGVALPADGVQWPGEAAEARGSVVWYLLLSALAAGIIVGVRLMQEAIVRRRQSFDSIDEARADDALRSASIQGLAGLGYGGPMWIGAMMAWDLALSTTGRLTGIFDVGALILAVVGFGMLVGFPRLDSRWIVRRAREA